jgi:hypothetical protein
LEFFKLQLNHWPGEAINLPKGGAAENTDAHGEAKRILALRDLHYYASEKMMTAVDDLVQMIKASKPIAEIGQEVED